LGTSGCLGPQLGPQYPEGKRGRGSFPCGGGPDLGKEKGSPLMVATRHRNSAAEKGGGKKRRWDRGLQVPAKRKKGRVDLSLKGKRSLVYNLQKTVPDTLQSLRAKERKRKNSTIPRKRLRRGKKTSTTKRNARRKTSLLTNNGRE